MGKERRSSAAEEAEAKQAAEDDWRRASDDAVCVQHRLALEKKFGGNIQTKLIEAGSFEKVQFLQEIFKEFDVDNSGEMDMQEFFVTLRTCGFKVSRAAAMAIMKEVDVDDNGVIDIDEFVEFFKKKDDLEAFKYKMEKVQYASGARKQVISGYIFVLLAGCFGLLVLDIRNGGKDSTIRLIFIVLVVIFFASISSVLLLPLLALWFKPQEKGANFMNKLKSKLDLKAQKLAGNETGKVTLVEAVEIPAPPPHGAASNASEPQFSYRRGGKHSHRSQDPGFGEFQGTIHSSNVPMFENAAWESPDAPRVEQDLALVPIDQNDMPAVVQAPREDRYTGANQYAFPDQRYALSQYDQAREMAARQAKNDWMRENFTPWSQSRHRPVAALR